jgi:hypothetical protein
MKKFRKGELVYVTPGAPYHGWDGMSATVLEINAGDRGRYIRIKTIVPMPNGIGGMMSEALFHPGEVRRENRPWLRKYLKNIVKLREKLKEVAEFSRTLE